MTGHFELWGYPGAGKSTVASLLRNEWGLNVPKLMTLRKGIAARPIRSRLLFARSGVVAGRLVWPLPDRTSRMAIVSQAVRQASTLAGQSTPCLLEEGTVHEIWRNLYQRPDLIARGWWKRYLSPSPTGVIILDVSPARAQERLRSKTRLGPVSRELRDAPLDGPLWRKAGDALAAITIALALRPGVTRLPTEHASVETICGEIARLVRKPLH